MCTAPLTCGQSSIRSVKHKLHSSSHGPLAKSKFPMEGERESYVRQCHHGDAYEFWQNHQNVLCCMLIYPRPILVIVDCPSKQAIFISHSWHHHFCWASIPLHYPCTLQRFYITSNHGSKFALNFHFLGTALDMCLYFSLAFDCPQFLTSWMEHLHHCSIISFLWLYTSEYYLKLIWISLTYEVHIQQHITT